MDQFSHDYDHFAELDESSAARSGSRDSLLLTAQLRLAALATPVQVRVRNLSPGGLMAEYAGPARSDDPIDVEVRGIGWITGRVAWVTEGRIGIAFTAPIDPLLARKPVKPVVPPLPARKRGLAPL